MNRKGFTLIELLAVIAVMGLIALIAIPNIVGLQDGIKKDQMLDDAKKLISMAKYRVDTDYDIRNFTKSDTGISCSTSSKSCTMTLAILNTNGDIGNDPDGGSYHQTSSKVKYSKNASTGIVSYCVYLLGSKRKIGTSITNCVSEENLYSRSNVVDR